MAKASSSCDVADALIQLGVPGGGLLPDITAWSPQRDHDQKTVVGPAYTVKYEYIDPINGPVNNQTGHYVCCSQKSQIFAPLLPAPELADCLIRSTVLQPGLSSSSPVLGV